MDKPIPAGTARPVACIYCGCTDDRACLIPLADFDSPTIREAYAQLVAECESLRAPVRATTACWWISKDPPVCSAPACSRRFAAARLFDLVTDDGEGDASREIAGQGAV